MGSPEVKLQLGDELWADLAAKIKVGGLRHALHMAYMPTMSTSDSYCVSTGFEPLGALVSKKSNSRGELIKYSYDALEELSKLPRWPEIYEHINTNHYLSTAPAGLVPEHLVTKYKVAAEYDQNELLAIYARVQKFVDQGMSVNLHYHQNSEAFHIDNISDNIYQGWRLGAKTLVYYLVRNDTEKRAKVYVATAEIESPEEKNETDEMLSSYCTREEGCISCSA
jgi:ribonucleotide reductase alpha subunit